jgi:hypothetical protein
MSGVLVSLPTGLVARYRAVDREQVGSVICALRSLHHRGVALTRLGVGLTPPPAWAPEGGVPPPDCPVPPPAAAGGAHDGGLPPSCTR